MSFFLLAAIMASSSLPSDSKQPTPIERQNRLYQIEEFCKEAQCKKCCLKMNEHIDNEMGIDQL